MTDTRKEPNVQSERKAFEAWLPTRIWIDCEFNEHAGRHELISMALIADDGREWYEVLPCARPGSWVAENVIPRLGKAPITQDAFSESLREFLAPYAAVHIIADWPSDIALFCDALIVGPGCRIDTPPLTLEIIRLDGESADPHNALADARGIRDVHRAALAAVPQAAEPPSQEPLACSLSEGHIMNLTDEQITEIRRRHPTALMLDGEVLNFVSDILAAATYPSREPSGLVDCGECRTQGCPTGKCRNAPPAPEAGETPNDEAKFIGTNTDRRTDFGALLKEAQRDAEPVPLNIANLRITLLGLGFSDADCERICIAAVSCSPPIGRNAEPVATLHDDGCFTWKRDEYRLKYDRQRAGWRMDVYAAPLAQRDAERDSMLLQLANVALDLNTGWNNKETESLIAQRIDLLRRLANAALSAAKEGP